MKYYELTKEEEKILKDFEKGEFIPVKNVEKAKREAILAAKNTLNKTRNINIRLSEKDLLKIKSKAVREGIPYQTLVSSFLHRFASS